jgi:hypothetical protein
MLYQFIHASQRRERAVLSPTSAGSGVQTTYIVIADILSTLIEQSFREEAYHRKQTTRRLQTAESVTTARYLELTLQSTII